MNSNITREIKLNSKLVEVVTIIQAELKNLQEQYKAKSDQLGTTLSGVCLQEGIDVNKERLELTPDFSTILVYEITPEEIIQTASAKQDKKKK